MEKGKNISVIVIAIGVSKRNLLSCVDSIKFQLEQSDEIIVVGKKIYRDNKIKFINGNFFTNRKNINRAIIAAQNDVIIINGHSIVSKNWIENYKQAFIANELSLIKGKIELSNSQIEKIYLNNCPIIDRIQLTNIGLSKKLISKIRQNIDQDNFLDFQKKNFILGSYPDIIMKLKLYGGTIVDIDNQISYSTGFFATCIENFFSALLLEKLNKKYKYLDTGAGNFKNYFKYWLKIKKNNQEIFYFFCWLTGSIVGKLVFALRHPFLSFKPIRWLKQRNYLPWRTNKNLIDIELTSYCNLNCFNCDRAIGQAPTSEHISLEQIEKFVSESINEKKYWQEIKILGGEPTLHPQFFEILNCFEKYRKFSPKTSFILISNGYSERTKNILNNLPDWLFLENSAKTSNIHDFRTCHLAPCDSNCRINPRNACADTEFCGLGFNRYGYYLCGPGASIDRIFGFGLGITSLKQLNIKILTRQRELLCRYCGKLNDPFETNVAQEEKMSASWQKACDKYKETKPNLKLY